MPPNSKKSKGKGKKLEIDLTASSNAGADHGGQLTSDDYHRPRDLSPPTSISKAVEKFQKDIDRVHGPRSPIAHMDHEMQDILAQFGIHEYWLLPGNPQHEYRTWLRMRAGSNLNMESLEDTFRSLDKEPHQRAPTAIRRKITIEEFSPPNNGLSARPISSIYDLLNYPEDYVQVTMKLADGSVRTRVHGPFEGYSPRYPTLPGVNVMLASIEEMRDAQDLAARAVGAAANEPRHIRAYSTPLVNAETLMAGNSKSGPNEHADQAANSLETNTTLAKAGSSKPHPIKAKKNFGMKHHTPTDQLTPSNRGENDEEAVTLDPGVESIVKEQDTTRMDATQPEQVGIFYAISDPSMDHPRGDQAAKGSGSDKKCYEPKHWLWMNNWARENKGIKHRDAEMARAFNKEFQQSRSGGAMKNKFQALDEDESKQLEGDPKTLAFYQDPKNIPRKLEDKARPGHGTAKGRKSKRQSTVKIDEAEENSEEPGEMDAAPTGSTGSPNRRKRGRGIAEALESQDNATKPATGLSRSLQPQKKVRRR